MKSFNLKSYTGRPAYKSCMSKLLTMNKAIVFALGVLLCGSAARAQKSVSYPDLWSADWSLSQAKNLNSIPKDAVRNAMNPIWENADSHLCAFQFADLRHSGTLSLVLSGDGGGTVDCNYVDVINKSPTGIEDYHFNQPHALFHSVDDLNGNGSQELLIDQDLNSDTNCIASLPIIYAWTGSEYADVSNNYKGWYEQQLASLNKKIAAEGNLTEDHGETPGESAAGSGSQQILSYSVAGNVPEGSAPSQSPAPNSLEGRVLPSVAPPAPDEGLSCLKADAVKIESFLGASRDAYMDDAIRWAGSEDPHDRELLLAYSSILGLPRRLTI